jgi:hypothetical protein
MELTSQGRNELRIYLDSAEAKTIDEEGSILFQVNSTVIASVNVRVPVEARYSDVDTEPATNTQTNNIICHGSPFQVLFIQERQTSRCT